MNEERAPLSPVNPSQSPLDAAPAVPTLDEVSAQVRTWVHAAATRPIPGPAKMLSDLLQDPKGLEFTLAFVDRVIRPEDPRAAAVELHRLAQDPPAFLPAPLRRVIALGGAASTLAPSLVVPTAQAAMRRMVGHLILDARPRPLSSAIQRLTADGTALNLNLLGEAVLGAQEADRRLQGVRELVARDDVDYASIKVSSIVDHLPLWAAEETVDHIVETLLPLYLEAARGKNPTFLNMDMEEYRDLKLTLQVFEKLLDRPELASLHAGIVLQAYLPDAPSAMARLRRFGERRVAAGGEPIKVRLVKGANLALEQVDASVHGWTQAPLLSKEETDAQYKRMLLEALDPAKLAAVHLGVAGHNLFDVAFAHLLMQGRGIQQAPGTASSSRCSPGWRRDSRRWCARPPARCVCTCRSCTPATSMSPSPTWCGAWRRTRPRRTSSPRPSSWTAPRSSSPVSGSASPGRWTVPCRRPRCPPTATRIAVRRSRTGRAPCSSAPRRCRRSRAASATLPTPICRPR